MYLICIRLDVHQKHFYGKLFNYYALSYLYYVWIENLFLQGGSWISTGDEASQFARFAFRRHFFQHVGFRLVRTAAADQKVSVPIRICTNKIYISGVGFQGEYMKLGCLPTQSNPPACSLAYNLTSYNKLYNSWQPILISLYFNSVSTLY